MKQLPYIDCNTGNVIPYTHGVTAVSNAYFGSIFSPNQNRIYFIPAGQANQATWHYIQDFTNERISISLMSGAMFNKL